MLPELMFTNGDGIVKQLNAQYKTSIVGNYVLVDTSVKGYIEGMKDAVDSGVCHVSVAAKKIATDYDNQFILFNSKQVHAIVGDAIDLYTYRTSGSCQDNCYVRAFGDPSFFSTFTTLSITSGTVCVKMTSIVLMFILSVLSVF